MEEKKVKNRNSLRTIVGFRFFDQFLFFKSAKSAILHASIKNKKNKILGNFGFTLIEVLIVMGIIGVLAASFLIIINPAYQLGKARDGHRKSDIQQIRSALELYRSDCGNYPSSLPSSLSSSTPTCASPPNPVASYMSSVPIDPKTKASYQYALSATGYSLYACLENKDDPDGVSNGACPSTFSYSVTNP